MNTCKKISGSDDSLNNTETAQYNNYKMTVFYICSTGFKYLKCTNSTTIKGF